MITSLFPASKNVLKASLHENGSTVSALGIPNHHGMGTYWDIWFTHSALLRTNHIDEAVKINQFWQLAYSEARKVARGKYGVEGARFEWVLKMDGTPFYHSNQLHNNLIPIITVWEQYSYTSNLNILKANYKLLEDCLLFIIRYALKKDRDKYYLIESISVDESSQEKKNELLATAVTFRSIKIMKTISDILNVTLHREISQAYEPFKQILDSLRSTGFYYAYQGATEGSWATPLAHIHLPEPENFSTVIEHALEGCRESDGLGIGKASRLRCASFPWAEGVFAWSMVLNNDKRAVEYLKMMTRFVNSFNGISEHVWDTGCHSRAWFVAAHGVFLSALVDLCVRKTGNIIEIFPLGTDSIPWPKVRFNNFRLPGGMLVSCLYKKQECLKITITNDSEFDVELKYRFSGETSDIFKLAKYGTRKIELAKHCLEEIKKHKKKKKEC